MARHNGYLLLLSILCLLLFQGWLAKYHANDLAERPIERAERAGSDAAAGVGLEVAITDHPAGGGWVRTRGIPGSVDRKLNQISAARRGAIATGGNTLIDATVQLNSAQEFICYLPRAIQVGLLSPFPELWRGEGSTPAMTLARKVMGVVTAFFYICLLGLFAGLFFFRKNLDFWIIFAFCLSGILVYTFTYPNVGTLMRYRYGFYMPLISFGAAFVVEQMLNWRGKRCQSG